MSIRATFLPLADRLYDLLTIKRTCSVQFDPELFDDQPYTIDEFYYMTSAYFDKPGLFYDTFNSPYEQDIIKLSNHTTSESFFSYPSPIASGWNENNKAYFKLFSNNKRSDTLLLFVPGWARKNLIAEAKFCHQLLKNRIDACLLVKPFHQERTPANMYSGELFISANMYLTIMNFRQLVAEIRFLLNYFRKQYKYVGMIGMSSGGMQAALAADVEPVDFYFPLVTGAQLGTLAWNSIFTKFVKKDLIKKGVDEAQLNKAWAIADQLYLGHNCKAAYIKQFISVYDEAVGTQHQYLLNDIYNNPDTVEMKCAHNSVIFYFNKIVNEITKAVKERT
jgi:hypothetical protein